MKRILALVLATLLLFSLSGCLPHLPALLQPNASPSSEPTPTATPAPTPSPTAAPTPTPSPTKAPTPEISLYRVSPPEGFVPNEFRDPQDAYLSFSTATPKKDRSWVGLQNLSNDYYTLLSDPLVYEEMLDGFLEDFFDTPLDGALDLYRYITVDGLNAILAVSHFDYKGKACQLMECYVEAKNTFLVYCLDLSGSGKWIDAFQEMLPNIDFILKSELSEPLTVSFDPPAGWQSAGQNDSFVSPEYPTDPSLAFHLNLGAGSIPKHAFSSASEFSKFVQNNIQSLTGKKVKISMKEFRYTLVDGYPALYARATYKLAGNQYSETILLIQADTLHEFSCTQTNTTKWTDAFSSMLGSVHFRLPSTQLSA